MNKLASFTLSQCLFLLDIMYELKISINIARIRTKAKCDVAALLCSCFCFCSFFVSVVFMFYSSLICFGTDNKSLAIEKSVIVCRLGWVYCAPFSYNLKDIKLQCTIFSIKLTWEKFSGSISGDTAQFCIKYIIFYVLKSFCSLFSKFPKQYSFFGIFF